MAAAAPVRAPAGTRFLPLVFEVHGGCTGDTAREIRHLLNAWSEQNGYDETRCAVNRHAWRYYIACMLAHAVQAQVRWLAETMAASGYARALRADTPVAVDSSTSLKMWGGTRE